MTSGQAMPDRFAEFLKTRTGWRRWLAAAVLGALAAAAQPPLFVLPVLLISFPGLVWLLDGAGSRRAAFAAGWFFGAGYFAAGLYWVSHALLVDADRFAWLIPFAVLGLSFGLGLFTGVMALVARAVWAPGMGRVLVLAATWAVFEWVRGTVLTGFPWNPVGNVWTAVPPVLQAAAVIGVYGLSALTVFAAAAPALLSRPGRYRIAMALSGCAVLAAVAGAGSIRLAADAPAGAPGVTLRIVQPNIPQRDKWRPEKRAENFARSLRLSTSPPHDDVTHVIWPETALPVSAAADPAGRALLRRAVPDGGSLLTGVLRVERSGGRPVAVWNSLAAVDGTGRAEIVYDKHHLVPFGEYMPFRSILPLEKITAGAIDFTAGPGLLTRRLPGLPAFSPLICYEVIFPGKVARGDDRPAWLLNVTNDAWFGLSAGPHQHFASARLRAVEEGLPLIRAANTGISGAIDPFGRIVAALPLGREGHLDVPLPGALSVTPFARYGNLLPAILVGFLYFLAGLFFWNQRTIKNETFRNNFWWHWLHTIVYSLSTFDGAYPLPVE